ncbi:MAG TPA: 2-oxoacid:acceptor oxidoreductase subunit alpha [Synergistales bacterium]|nr:2-oxoacid:acceptor oxidoreductase subunit alpha [Synergistales bacterium]
MTERTDLFVSGPVPMFSSGNEAIAEGALAAGARFYAGYPITPSSEVAEAAARRMPEVGGVYIQMEDELSSMAAIIGASAAGKKAFTATSGPGFSLMQENLGMAAMGEIPCVVVNVQRSGPSTGMATKPAQGDVMQARWGTHGDHGIIALAPSSVQDCYDMTIRAFNLAEKYRTPVVLLADAAIAKLRERAVFRAPSPEEVVERAMPTCPPEEFCPFAVDPEERAITPLPPFGGDYVIRITGSMHDERGGQNATPENADRVIRHLTDKLEKNRADIIRVREYALDDAEYALVSFGCSARASRAAVKQARALGKRVGLLELTTLWPFPDDEVRSLLSRVKGAAVVEMNLGQVVREVRRLNDFGIPVLGVHRVDGMLVAPADILSRTEEAFS